MNNVYEVEEGKEENPYFLFFFLILQLNKIQRAACPKKEEEEEEKQTRQGSTRYRALSYLCYSFKCKNRNEYIFTHFRWIVDN